MSHRTGHRDPRGPERERPEAGGSGGGAREPEAPEREMPEEALLLSEWAGSLSPAEDLPEEVLGLLDGTLDEAEAARVRRRLADDPALARAVGELVASWRESSPASLGREVPGHLLREAADLVPPADVPDARPGFLSRLLAWTRLPAAPGLAAAGAAVLLIGFVLLERERVPPPSEPPALRATTPAPGAIALSTPESDARVTGDLVMRWEEVPGAVRYRVVLVSAADGEVTDAGHTSGTELTATAALLAQRFGEDEPRALHWIVRAHLLDGTEVSSGPRRIVWSAR